MRLHSKRLRAILDHLRDTRVLYDVGTDHAYLPIAAVKELGVEKAIAVDNKLGPLSRAEKNVEEADLSHAIGLKHIDGLQALTDDVDTVVVAGLGGHTIYNVIHEADLKHVKRFVLQPNDHPEMVRMLCDIRPLAIIEETYAIERDTFYPIIVMEEGSMTLSESERYYGPILIQKREKAYMRELIKEYARLLIMIEQVPQRDKLPLITKKALLEEIFYERK
ncbi:MAG: tRNA (adenine(22)-N(1))-methyltransferase [Candidatus Izemoplasmataceae bacterium]